MIVMIIPLNSLIASRIVRQGQYQSTADESEKRAKVPGIGIS
ncbi:hypothetical protein FHS21_001277 [Phyllobacterium trifolii]|jgi:hypothetical protein|uniref:Uncharacterized protein n=1 Tax=Phyllobacterium trifolii TaxID=300193 RepID=A0A839U1N8_9HYPH|nr:hypothetical protein [Phyllobacterium trifolii]